MLDRAVASRSEGFLQRLRCADAASPGGCRKYEDASQHLPGRDGLR